MFAIESKIIDGNEYVEVRSSGFLIWEAVKIWKQTDKIILVKEGLFSRKICKGLFSETSINLNNELMGGHKFQTRLGFALTIFVGEERVMFIRDYDKLRIDEFVEKLEMKLGKKLKIKNCTHNNYLLDDA